MNKILVVCLLLAVAGAVLAEEPLCSCPMIYSPICSTTGKTYSNACTMHCYGESQACSGPCPCATK